MLDFEDLRLTQHEGMVLANLMLRHDRAVSAYDLLNLVGSQGKLKTCTVHICRIRKALKAEQWPAEIQTIYGVGYRFRWVESSDWRAA